jgi:hypothetical protein
VRADDHRDRRRDGQGGIPDGLLIGMLAFLLGMTLLVWTATGLAGLFAHGAWPDGVTFTRTPLAMRQLIAEPHDIAGAWADTPAAQLSGYGLFWGLFIGELMLLFVLTMFTVGTLARWKAVRLRRRAERRAAPAPEEGPRTAVPHDSPRTAPQDAPLTAPHEVAAPAPRAGP